MVHLITLCCGLQRTESRFLRAFCTFDEIITNNKTLLMSSGFVGISVWICVSSLYYLSEKDNDAMYWEIPGCSVRAQSVNF